MTDYAHPSLDDLADLHEGLLSHERSNELFAHLSACRVCSTAMASIDEVEAMLAESGKTELAMPAAVAASLDEALRRASVERATGVASLSDRRASSAHAAAAARHRPRWTLVAGAAASALVIGYAGVNLLGHTENSVTSSADSAPVSSAQSLDQKGTAGAGGAAEKTTPESTFDIPGRREPRVVTRQTLATYAETLTARTGVGATGVPPCSAAPVDGGDLAAAVRWRGAVAVVVVDPAARRATVYDCGAAPARLFSTTY